MKVFAISDLHLSLSVDKPMDIFGGAWNNYLQKIKDDWKTKVKDEDIVIIAGDISWAMKLEGFEKDIEFFDDLPGKKIMIRGNHDYWWGSVSKIRNILKKDMFVLQNDAIKFGDYIFCGTRGWDINLSNSTKQDKKIFEREKIRLELALKQAKQLQDGNEKIVAIIHYPPFTAKNKDNDFINLFKKYEVDIVVFGHLHNDKCGLMLVSQIDKAKYFLTSCDLVNNKLIQILP